MSTDTKHTTAVIGTIVATGVALAGFLTTSLGGRITNVENEVRALRGELREEIRTTDQGLREQIQSTDQSLREQIRATDQSLREQIRATDQSLREQIRGTRTELLDEIRATRTELLDDIRALDARVRTVETGFARVDQRLATIERAVIPSAEPPQ